MFGNNPIRPPVNSKNNTPELQTLDIQDIFSTLQGEGPHAGEAAVFIRLGGCNLACAFCDTEFEQFSPRKPDEIIDNVIALSQNNDGKRIRHLVVVTGGEPMRQPIEYLCGLLVKNGFKVQVETNGTLYRAIDKNIDIICSPKNNGQGYSMIREDLLQRITALKFIISANNKDYYSVGEVGQTHHNIPVYVQPMDEYDEEKNAANHKRVRELVQQGYAVSLQLHKILGLP